MDVWRARDIRIIIINMFQCYILLESNTIIQYAWDIIHTTAINIDERKLFAILSTCFKNDGGFLICRHSCVAAEEPPAHLTFL